LKAKSIPQIFFLLLLAITPISGFAFNVPSLGSRHVIDKAHVLSRPTEDYLQNILGKIKQATKTEMVVLTVKSLQGEPIEQASIQIVDKWQLGTQKEDKGLLLLLAVKDHKLRFEVGQGLEGTLTDLASHRIIDDSMVPLLKSGDYDSAVIVGSFQALKVALPQTNIEQYFGNNARRVVRRHRSFSWFKLLFYLLMFLFFISSGRGGLLAFLLGSSMGGRGSGLGGGGLGGFGGGGFGGGLGGGGGFSGGGSSGSW